MHGKYHYHDSTAKKSHATQTSLTELSPNFVFGVPVVSSLGKYVESLAKSLPCQMICGRVIW